MKITELIEKSYISAGLIRAVVRQAGGWESFQKITADVAQYGADIGWAGFKYHTETLKFFLAYRDLIRQLIEKTAAKRRDTAIGLILSFPYHNTNRNLDAIGITLYGPRSSINTAIAKAIACFTLDMVAREYLRVLVKYKMLCED